MEIKKGTKLKVFHSRKGHFVGIASADFNTDDEWYNIAVADEQKEVSGLTKSWLAGEETPCRKGLTHITVI